MIVERSNARATSKNPWLTQPRRQFPHAARLNPTPSERLPERRPHTSPQPGQSPVQFYISRRLKQIHPSRRRARWRLRGQPQMREDAADSGRILDGRDGLQWPAAVRAALNVDIEHALQQLRPMRQNSTRFVHLHESSPSTSPTLSIGRPDLSLEPPSRISIW